jgi:chemotaxis protein CheC
MAEDDTKPNKHSGDDPTPQAHRLSDLEMDALTEVVNIGVSRAANSLRDLVGEQVFLTVPSLAILTRAEAAALISRRSGNQLIAVRQAFQGEFAGSALLIFPETNSLELIRAVTKGELSLEDIIELEQEALAEIGNIILNSCMATIANLLQRSLKMSLPEILRGSGLDFFESHTLGAADGVLFIRINFTLKGREISGYVAIVMDFLSLEALQGLIADFIANSTR